MAYHQMERFWRDQRLTEPAVVRAVAKLLNRMHLPSRSVAGRRRFPSLCPRPKQERQVAMLSATFIPDARDMLTGARCELPSGEVVEVKGRRTPFFALCRELDKRGYGDRRIEISTPKGTQSLRGLVKVMAGLRIEESDKDGLRLRAYTPFPPAGVGKEGDLGFEGIQAPEREEMPASDSTVHEKAA